MPPRWPARVASAGRGAGAPHLDDEAFSLGPQVVVDPLTQYAEPAPTLLADPGWARTCTRIGSSAAEATDGSAITWRSCTRHILQLTAITVRCPDGS